MNHDFAGERPYTCPICQKCFARRSALRIHKVSVHEDVKSFLCPECGSAFKANSALIDHRKRVHLQIKQHQCDYCKKDFFSKKDHSEHIRTHTGEKPFQCSVNHMILIVTFLRSTKFENIFSASIVSSVKIIFIFLRLSSFKFAPLRRLDYFDIFCVQHF